MVTRAFPPVGGGGVQRMIKLAHSPELRKTQGQAARKHAVENFSLDGQILKLAALLEEVHYQ